MSSNSPPSIQVLAITEAGETPAVSRGVHSSGLSSPSAIVVMVKNDLQKFESRCIEQLKWRSALEHDACRPEDYDINSEVSRELELLSKKHAQEAALKMTEMDLEDNCHKEAITKAGVEKLLQWINTRIEDLRRRDLPPDLPQTFLYRQVVEDQKKCFEAAKFLSQKEKYLKIEKHELLCQKYKHEYAIAKIDHVIAIRENIKPEERREAANRVIKTEIIVRQNCKVDDDMFQARKNTRRAHEDNVEFEQPQAAKRARCN